MRRKCIIIVVLLLSVLMYAFGLFACGEKFNGGSSDDKPDVPPSQHTTHSYVTSVIEPTCVNQGYTLHKCECGDEYKDNYTDPSGHQWDIERIIEKSTCTKDGIKEIECAVCHATKKENIPAAHSWGDWISFNDDSHVRHCGVCQEKETEEHIWVNNVCTICNNEIFGYTVGLKYSEVKENNTIIGYCVDGIGSAKDVDIVIPSVHNDLPVISVKGKAFDNCTEIKSIVIPNSIESIGFAALSGCSELQSLTTPFVGCCPNSDRDSGLLGYLFGVEEYENSVKTEQINYSFLNTTETAAFYIPNALKKIVITKGNISSGAFSGCENITEVILNDGINRIGENAFNGCSNLVKLEIPDSIYYVGKDALSGCDRLKYTDYNNGKYFGSSNNPHLILVSIINKTVTQFATHDNTKCILPSFYELTDLSSLTIPNGITSVVVYGRDPTTMDNLTASGAMTKKNGFVYVGNKSNPYLVLYNNRFWCTDLIIEPTTKIIADYALYDSGYYNRDDGLVIPDSVQYIGKACFTGGGEVQTAKKIVIGNGVVDMEDAFVTNTYGSDLEEIVVSENNKRYVTVDGVLYNRDCTELLQYPSQKTETDYSILSSCKRVCFKAFYGAKALKNVNFPNGLIDIGSYSFYGTGIEHLEISKRVVSIGVYAFAYGKYDGLMDIVISDSVTCIWGSAFHGANFENISLGEGVLYIGRLAFSPKVYDSLIKVYYSGTIAKWCEIYFADSIFFNRTKGDLYIDNNLLSEIKIPDTVTKINDYAFQNFNSLVSVEIPNSVTSIGGDAFRGCSGLTSVYYGGSVSEWNKIIIVDKALDRATKYYYSANKPAETGNYWHYDDNGQIVIWG